MLLLPIIAASMLSAALNDMNTAMRLQRSYSTTGEQGSVLFQAWIAPSGQVLECAVLEGSGSAGFSSTFCSNYRKLRIAPAKDAEGRHSYSLIRSTVVLSSRRGEGLEVPADVTLTAKALPEGASEYRVYANLLVDEQGAVEACEVKQRIAATYTELVCTEAIKSPFGVRYDTSGQAVRYVTGFTTLFKAETVK